MNYTCCEINGLEHHFDSDYIDGDEVTVSVKKDLPVLGELQIRFKYDRNGRVVDESIEYFAMNRMEVE